MEEDSVNNDSFPELRELENKVGRKTPESLLIWMRDAADCEGDWRSDVVDRAAESSSARSDSFSDKINSLRQEMRWLQSADVRILRQLVAVHEGIEAMRWLMEERDTLASRSSSLMGSLSSLATIEEHGTSMSPCRENLSPTLDLTETTGEESEDHSPHTDHGDARHFDMRSDKSSGAGPPRDSSFLSSAHGKHDQASSSSPANGWACDGALSLGIRTGGDTIKRALLRSQKREAKDSKESAVHRTPKSLRALQKNSTEREESGSDKETHLLGYDAQWCWVESQDDVTFL